MLVNHVVRREQASILGIEPCRRRNLGSAVTPRLLIDEVVQASRHLDDADRALVRAVYERGLALKALATVHGTSKGRLHHRLRVIVRRLRSPLFRLVVRERGVWPAERRFIAETVVLRGKPQRKVAKDLGVSLHRVRTELEHLKALAGVHRIGGDV